MEITNDRIKFNVGDEVYHKTNNESPKGIVIDILYSFRKDEFRYIVSFGVYNDQEVSLIEQELSTEKSLI